jgi:hypothetical protein
VFLKTFSYSLLLTAAALFGVWRFGGPSLLFVVAVLAILEVSLSFDNAVVNATVLNRMSPRWQRAFLTIGVLIAVVGMRLVFPFLVVAVTARLNPAEVLTLAIRSPDQYAAHLSAAHPAIACFGGTFLAMIFLDFIFEEREIPWLRTIENFFSRIGRIQSLSTIVGLVMILVVASLVPGELRDTMLTAGLLGLVSYLAIGALGTYFSETGDRENADTADTADAGGITGGVVAVAGAVRPARSGPVGGAVGRAALALFLYLELLDASFSFDGVIAAFAISSNILVIALGLGIGALYVRSLTVYLVRVGTLNKYVYLEHGAHYAIGALAVFLFISIDHDVPELVTGLVSVGVIGLAFLSSVWRQVRRRRRSARARAGAGGAAAATGGLE